MFELIRKGVYWILAMLSSIMYTLATWIYRIFIILANGANIIDRRMIDEMVKSIYVILGVVVLFLVAYSLLKSMVNPDEALKGKKSPLKTISDVVISIAAVALVPTIFEFAFAFQNSLLTYNTIGKLILGNTATTMNVNETIANGGHNMSQSVWQAFIILPDDKCRTEVEEKNGIRDGKPCTTLYAENGDTYSEVWSKAKTLTFFSMAGPISTWAANDEITYFFLIDLVAGIFIAFVLLSYCLDMAIRLVKLAVYEIIAPIPILARIIPNEQAGKIFSNWLKAVISTFVEVFIRIAIMYFAVMIISVVISSFDNIFLEGAFGSSESNPVIKLLAQALIIIGIILFVKQAPEIIKEITGLDGGKYNPLKSLKQGISAIAGGIAGGSLIAAVRAWDQAGQSKELLDFSAIGNQWRRRQARLEAAAQGARRRDRWSDALRKRFGFETQLELANRRLDRGLDMQGNVQENVNDTDDAITFIDEDGNVIGKIDKGEKIVMTDQMINDLKHQKDVRARKLSEIEEQKRHISEGNDLNKHHYDNYGEFKKEGEKKTHEGHNDMLASFYEIEKDANGEWQYKRDANGNLIVLKDPNTGQEIKDLNYAALEKYTKSREAQGASPEELQQLQYNLQKTNDSLRLDYVSREIMHKRGYSSQLWGKWRAEYEEFGIYDATTGKNYWLDVDLDELERTGKAMDIFSKKDGYKRINKDGSAYTGNGSVQIEGAGIDLTVKKEQQIAARELQLKDNEKSPHENINKRIDRVLKQTEERTSAFKSSEEYQRYKASDNANKINDSGKK